MAAPRPVARARGMDPDRREATADAGDRRAGAADRRSRLPRLGCPIAVNVSPRQFTDPDFAAKVLAALGDCPPSALISEVTESSVMTDPIRANEALELLRVQGIRIALDDFGTQYSSLSRLSTVPFDIVKIDRRSCPGCCPTRAWQW